MLFTSPVSGFNVVADRTLKFICTAIPTHRATRSALQGQIKNYIKNKLRIIKVSLDRIS